MIRSLIIQVQILSDIILFRLINNIMIQFLLIFNFARADINWPFTSCPGSPYVPKIVTLSAPPARNVNIIFKVIGIS